MGRSPKAVAGDESAEPVPRTLYRVAAAAMAVAAVGVAFLLYDMARPNTFVGDMYGLIVLVRLAVLAPCVLALLVGGVLAVVGWTRRRRGLCIAGAVVIFIATVPVLGMTGQAAWDRHQNAVRAAYPDRSVEDLLRLATEEDDQFAIDALGTKGDPVAVPGLRAMLLDAKRPTHLRTCAAQALANIGGPAAREALETARERVSEPHVQRAVGYALEDLKAAGEAAAPH
ncbi:MAG: HEAT repeat domain-containing protein [Phycisphaerae bacterium]